MFTSDDKFMRRGSLLLKWLTRKPRPKPMYTYIKAELENAGTEAWPILACQVLVVLEHLSLECWKKSVTCSVCYVLSFQFVIDDGIQFLLFLTPSIISLVLSIKTSAFCFNPRVDDPYYLSNKMLLPMMRN